MKKTILVILAIMVAALTVSAFAEEQNESKIGLYATINDALAETKDLGIDYANDDYYSVVVDLNGRYIRIITELDAEAKEKRTASVDPDRLADWPMLKNDFISYAKMLPVFKIEEIVAQPIPEDVLEAYTSDKNNLPTLSQLDEDGFEYAYAYPVKDEGEEAENAVLLVENGMFTYHITLEVTEDEYYNEDSVGKAGELCAEKIELVGLGSNAANLKYAADGSIVPSELSIWMGFGSVVQGGDCIE